MTEKTTKVKVNETLANHGNITRTEEAGATQVKMESVSYSVKELAASSHQLFGVPRECVIAACTLAGMKQATEPEARKIISDFMNKEVK